ncbi:MAG: DUF547 domain-containing protein [Lacipirellulaceae bacterium]
MDKKKEYSGAYLWLAVACFVMPVAVAVAAFRSLPKPYTYAEIKPDSSGVDNQLWDQLLRNYVANGLVDYDGLKRDHHFEIYLKQLAKAQPEKLASDAERLALHCNAYNAFVINGVIIHKVKNNVLTDVVDQQDLDGDGDREEDNVFFDHQEHIFGGKTISLNHLEHDVIRPTYNEPRIHVALVCAAKSCPEIRPEAYLGERIDEQLEDQATLFANNPKHVRYDEKEGKLYLSAILNWYSEDFDASGGVVGFLEKRAKGETLLAGLMKADQGEVEIVYNDYNWSLNTQGKTKTSGGGKSFCSGSIPNE